MIEVLTIFSGFVLGCAIYQRQWGAVLISATICGVCVLVASL